MSQFDLNNKTVKDLIANSDNNTSSNFTFNMIKSILRLYYHFNIFYAIN